VLFLEKTEKYRRHLMAMVEVKIPDIGDFKDVEIVELLVKPGDTVEVDQSILTVESDKASMEIPSTSSGVVREVKVHLGDTVSEGSAVLLLEQPDEGSPTPRAIPASDSPRVYPAEGSEAIREQVARDSIAYAEEAISQPSVNESPQPSTVDLSKPTEHIELMPSQSTAHGDDVRLWAVSAGVVIAPIAGLMVSLGIVSLKEAVPYVVVAGLTTPTLLYLIRLLINRSRRNKAKGRLRTSADHIP
jgi:pyruvate/2-oxoglutarate dehydrogenase complex dihydrolipoamide acyltransferase (E2) component